MDMEEQHARAQLGHLEYEELDEIREEIIARTKLLRKLERSFERDLKKLEKQLEEENKKSRTYLYGSYASVVLMVMLAASSLYRIYTTGC